MECAGEAVEALQITGFAPSGEDIGCADDEDGSRCPPPRASARGGGPPSVQGSESYRAVPVELWSCDKVTNSNVGFQCQKNFINGSFWAKLALADGGAASALEGQGAERSTKGAITTLLDVAEALNSRKIILGLNAEQAGCSEFVCSLLYLGFQVVPMRKTPPLLSETALLLDMELGYQAGTGLPWSSDGRYTTDHTFTGTSDCSTEAQDCGYLESDFPDSE
mmetsp:Transcript_107400/g.190186  ORF Transcript_107400/g.190186 Transcript_107400/m.190186 type:complete len:222 (-) Transcript_107400:437-1102(-)